MSSITTHPLSEDQQKQHATEAWILNRAMGNFFPILQKMTPVQLETVSQVLKTMEPLHTGNAFWKRHPLPRNPVKFKRFIRTALETIERRKQTTVVDRQHQIEAWAIGKLSQEFMPVLEKMTPDQLKTMAHLLTEMEPVSADNGFWQRHKLPAEDTFKQNREIALNTVNERLSRFQHEQKNLEQTPTAITSILLDYVITDKDQLGAGGAKTKYRHNVAALKVLKQLQSYDRPATLEEQAVLVRYVGWGGLPQAFDHNHSNWQKEFHELSALLSESEYEAARRSTQDAHYTSEAVIKGIYQGLQQLGFQGGKILEPAAGIGNFIGLTPETMRRSSRFTAIELDPVTAAIAKNLYPSATVINKGLESTTIPTGNFDLMVGNPPFGSQSLYDPKHKDLSKFSIHNYFIAKSLDKVREGGLMAFVVSRYFLDAENSAAREYIAERAHFLGAIRLPNTAFKRNALTEVTTDIVFLQKAHAEEVTDRAWVSTGTIADPKTGEAIVLNQYYLDHPEQMIGRMVITNTMHRGTVDLVAEPDVRLDEAIAQRLQVLPEGIYIPVQQQESLIAADDKPTLELPETLKVGSFFVTPDNRLARRLPDVLDRSDYEYVEVKNERAEQRVRGMVIIRDNLRQLFHAEQSDQASEEELQQLRNSLNQTYDRFVAQFGYISAQVNRQAMQSDTEYPLLQALENDYDKGISKEVAKKQGVKPSAPSAKKSAIFHQRVMTPRQRVTHVDSAKDALVVSMNESGRVDIARMVRLTALSEAQLLADLKDHIYFNPATEHWETADHYLSGNVKHKLHLAQQASSKNPLLQKNVEALLKVQPPDIEPIDIAVQMGSTWVPAATMQQFTVHLLGDSVRQQIAYQESLGKWFAEIKAGNATANKMTWGTENYPADKLIEAILTQKAIQVKRAVGVAENGKKIYEVDEVQTAAAHQKADEIRQAFSDWIWEDPQRRTELARIYNDRFNTNVPCRYDGAHLELPGASLGIQLRPHQKDAVWRGIQDGTALFDHVVGAGKTMVCVATIMESKRMGLMHKPMLVVPNHLLLQWKDSFYALYPSANILVADKNDFKKESRELLFARIATGDWDAVIVAHSSFKKIGMPEQTLNEILQEQVTDLSAALTQLRQESGDRITIKQMEKTKERLENRIKRAADTGSKDQAVNFVDLGVDALFVDEAHEFKNLAITTSLNRISGLGNLAGSEKAFDLFVKCRYLQQQHEGRGVFFATGTPISNTIAELYTMQRYLQYDELKQRGIAHFDAWASTFGQVVTGWELDATGVNYKLNSRFSKFQNVPELMNLYRTFADVITTVDLNRQAEARGQRFPIPKIKGGRPQNIVVERSQDQADFMGVQKPVLDHNLQPTYKADGSPIKDWNPGSIIHRMEHLPRDPRIDNPLKITNDARKAGLDFRLIDPEAEDFVNSKINTAVHQVHRIWKDWQEARGTQLVFCDLSTPKALNKTPPAQEAALNQAEEKDADDLPVISMDELLAESSRFSVYDDIKQKLIQKGVPAEEIRFIHEANTDLQKSKLFDEMNRGQVRILLGSTAKMGAGTNVQRKLVALHHLDAPWRPSDLEQREGRILRQGNEFYAQNPDGFEVEIIRYATRQTYDSRMWQTIEYKAAGIEQFRKGDSLVRVIEDVASEAANAAEMKAAATGNPLIFQQVQLSAELKKIEALYANHKRTQHSLESRVSWLANADQRAERAITLWNQEIHRRDQNTPESFHFEAHGRVYTADHREDLLKHLSSTLKQATEQQHQVPAMQMSDLPVGRYRGFEISVYAKHNEIRFVLEGASTHEPDNLKYRSEDKFSLSGFVNRVDNYLSKFEGWREEAHHKLQQERLEYQAAKQALGKPFPQQERLELLRQDVREVMTELKKMQADDHYVSEWKPKSQQVPAKEHQSVHTQTATTHDNPQIRQEPPILKLAEKLAHEKFSNEADRQRFLEKVEQRVIENQKTQPSSEFDGRRSEDKRLRDRVEYKRQVEMDLTR